MDVTTGYDLLCFSHLRWNFVFQRPNHLMTRAARDRRVFFIEEPVPGREDGLAIEVRDGVHVVTPILAPDGEPEPRLAALADRLVDEQAIRRPILWYETPMALGWTRHLDRALVVYDCMDQLSAFEQAPLELLAREAELLSIADLVFTGGDSLYEAKRSMHPAVHAFPSAVDVRHFRAARVGLSEPQDQAGLPHPRIGWFGVIDERMDLELVEGLAEARPDWSIVMVGPVVKIDPAALPRRDNLHWLGQRSYEELPAYLAGWDVAVMPFARNRATRYISPTKTPEYLAGGRPVVSTSVADVVRPYGELGLARIADDVEGFVAACEAAIAEPAAARIRKADDFLARISWDETWKRMDGLIRKALRPATRSRVPVVSVPAAAGTVARAAASVASTMSTVSSASAVASRTAE
jgi:UDP-galactopyranose mutase